MTLQEFKEFAGIEKLDFYKAKNGTLYAPTPIGVVFCAKEYKRNDKVQTVLPRVDDSGETVYHLSNKKSAFTI